MPPLEDSDKLKLYDIPNNINGRDMIDEPLVSVCVPSYNNARYIGKTLQSIIDQSYKNIEIIVSDNVSTDNTRDVVKLFNDSRIKYCRTDIHYKAAEDNYNVAINKSSGELIAIYHSDDLYDENIVFYQAGFLNKNRNCAAVFTLADKIDEDGNFINNFYYPGKFRTGGVFCFYDTYMAALRYGFTQLHCSSVMIRRSALETVGMFDSKGYLSAADTEMWFRIQEKFPVGIIGKRLLHYRMGQSQGTKEINYFRTTEADHLLVVNDYINSIYFTEEQRVRLQAWLSYQRGIDNVYRSIGLYLRKEYSLALELIEKSLNVNFILKLFKNKRGIKYLIMTLLIYVSAKVKVNFVFFRLINRIYNYRWS